MAFGVPLEHDLRRQRDVGLGERNLDVSAEADPTRLAHPLQSRCHVVGIDAVGVQALEPHQHRRHRAVAGTGGGERAEQLHPQVTDRGEHTVVGQRFDEAGGGAHRAPRCGNSTARCRR